MSRAHHVNDVLNEFGKEIGLEVELGEADRASLRFDGVLVTFAYRTQPIEMLWLYVDLGPIPTSGSAVPIMLLELNLHTWLRTVMTISIDRTGARARGHNVIPVATLDAASLKTVLQAMLDSAGQVRGLLEGAARLATTAADDDAPMPPGSTRV